MSRRFTLRSPEKLAWVMENPGRGARYSVRKLAEAAEVSDSLIGGLRSGRQKTADVLEAVHICRALGVGLLVLFMPPSTTDQDDVTTKILQLLEKE